MKYIDADALKIEIKHHIELMENEPTSYAKAKIDEANETLSVIDAYLQQEQPEGLHFTPLNRLIQKIPSRNWNDIVNNYAKKLCDCLIKEGYLKDAEVLQGYISYMNGNNVPMATMDEQEQPEVDLEKEWKSYMESRKDDLSGSAVTVNMKDLARHFYELGRFNARKEE